MRTRRQSLPLAVAVLTTMACSTAGDGPLGPRDEADATTQGAGGTHGSGIGGMGR